jgi:uncharacterized membrane protein
VEHFVDTASQYIALFIDALAIFVIAAGSLEAVVRGVALMGSGHAVNRGREVWLRYARWLVAGLTFQLAADIVHTAVAPTWDDIGRLAAIAAIRTFLTYFLDRDVERVLADASESRA